LQVVFIAGMVTLVFLVGPLMPCSHQASQPGNTKVTSRRGEV